MEIMANRMDRGFYRYQREFEEKALSVLRSGRYVLGKEVEAFEEEFAAFTGAAHCVGLASGLDALWIAFRCLEIGPGDEVIVQGNTYIASVMGITINGAVPVFVEPDACFGLDAARIEEKITERTRAILVVHLYGQTSDMGPILRLAEKYGLRVVEDCAQSHGACGLLPGNGAEAGELAEAGRAKAGVRAETGRAEEGCVRRMTGTFGDIGCFSFYPSKNLGAFGDAGAVVTDDAGLAEKIRIFRNYGSEKRYYNKVVGANSRLDELQAGLLRVRLRHLPELNAERQALCGRYLQGIRNPRLQLPKVREGCGTVWHQFVIRCRERDELQAYLAQKGIGTIIHYPIPPHLSEAYAYLGLQEGSLPLTERYAKEVLSIPLYNGMTEEEQNFVMDALNAF